MQVQRTVEAVEGVSSCQVDFERSTVSADLTGADAADSMKLTTKRIVEALVRPINSLPLFRVSLLLFGVSDFLFRVHAHEVLTLVQLVIP